MVKLNNQMQEVLDHYAALNPLPVESLSPEVARQLPEIKDALMSVINEHPTKRILGVMEDIAVEEHLLIPGPADSLLARVYKPDSEGPLPVLLYFHDGGFVVGNLNSYDASCRALANAASCMVVSLAYRQAPEHKYPAARDDAFCAYRWLLRHAESIGGDSTRIAVAGEGAGGNLATLVCLLARREGIAQPVHQLLICPLVDSSMQSESYQKFAYAQPLGLSKMDWFLSHYVRDESDKQDPFAFPILQRDLKGLAPATVFTAEVDPLCSEGDQYANKLKKSDVSVFAKHFEGLTHDFFGLGSVVDDAEEAVNIAADQLITAFKKDDDRLILAPETSIYARPVL